MPLPNQVFFKKNFISYIFQQSIAVLQTTPKLIGLIQQHELFFMLLHVGWAQLGDSSAFHGIGWVTYVTEFHWWLS